jgi:peptide subunit release factor 1 (eRF1)
MSLLVRMNPSMRDLLRRLAEFEPTALPVLSVYLDMRPQATGEDPGRRASLTILRDRLRAIEGTLGPRGEGFDSFHADADRIQAFLDDDFDRSSQGLAIFACSGAGLWETVEAGTPFEDEVGADAVPQLFQLARLLEEQESVVVAVADTNTARLFLSRVGRLEGVGGPDEDSTHFQKRSMGGWSQANYQRHIAKHHADFAQEAAGAIERLVDRHGAERVILAGDEVAMTPLMDALSERVRALVGDTLRVDIRAPREDVAAEIAPVLKHMEAEASSATADRVVAAVRSDGLGVAGLDATLEALGNGQVDLLVVDADAQLDGERRNELIRLAATSGAEVEVVEGHAGMDRLGGVGALLRYRLESQG